MEASGAGEAAPKIGVVIVHGVADAEQGQNLKTLTDTLEVQAEGALKPEAFLEVHAFEETSLISKAKQKLPLFVRRAKLDDRDVTFVEVYWADTTRVATGKATALSAAFRIVFEMHYFINALVPWNGGPWGRKIFVALLHAAALMIRGPIVGFNAVLLAVGAVYLSGQAIAKLAGHANYTIMTIPQAVLAVCATVLLGSIYYLLKNAGLRLVWRRWFWVPRVTARADLVPLEVCIFTVLVAAVACAIVGNMVWSGAKSSEGEVAQYGGVLFANLIWVWYGLSAAAAAAFVFAIGLTIWPWYEGKRRSLWAALGIVILQASLWAMFISLPAVLLLGLAKMAAIDLKTIDTVKYDLAVNFAGLSIVALIGIALMLIRSAIGYFSGRPKRNDTRRTAVLERFAGYMPRLIISPLLLTLIVIGGMLSVSAAIRQSDYSRILSGSEGWAIAVAALIFGFVLVIYSVLDTRGFVNVIHIARDLIDHHYEPRQSFVSFFYPKLRGNTRYPRRKRLLLRVDKALEFLVEDGCDAMVFAAHSQGTVIVFEYLNQRGNKPHFDAARAAVVTFGSPLDHLYAHYFQDYAKLPAMLAAQRRHVTSWTNLYRIDDPIGNRVVDAEQFVVNVPMERGGHTNYWIEKPVADAILRALAAVTSRQTPSAPHP